MYNRMMIDIETLGKTNDAVVLSVGYVVFNRQHKLSSSYWKLCQYEQILLGRKIDADTLNWWKKQSPEAYQAAFNGLVTGTGTIAGSVKQFADHLNDVYRIFECKEIWAQGVDFDVPIVENLLSDVASPTPWKYSAKRDSRTLRKLLNLTEPEQTGAHHALADAEYQAFRVMDCLNELEKIKKYNNLIVPGIIGTDMAMEGVQD